MSISLKNSYAGMPNTERGRNTVIAVDPKTKTKLIYGCGSNVVMRDLKDPLNVDVYTTHAHKVTVAKFAPSGYYVCSGDEQGNVRVWATDNADKTTKVEMRPLSNAIRDIAWTSDSQRIVAVGEGKGQFGVAFLWDSGSSVGDISGHSKEVLSCDVRQDRPFRIATGGEDNSVNFYQGPPFKFSHSNKDHKKFVNCVRFSPDGSLFVTVSSDKTAQFFDGKTGEKKFELDVSEGGHSGSIYSVSWSPDSKQILTASGDKTCKIWDVESKKCVKTFNIGQSTDYMQLACLWANAESLLSLNLNGDINFLNEADPANPVKRVLHGHNKKIYAVAVNAATNTMYSSGADGALIAWTIGQGPKKRLTGGHTNAIVSLALAGNTLVAASSDETVRFVNTDTEEYEGEAITLEGCPCDVAISKTNPDVVLVATQKNIHVISGRQIKSVLNVSFTPTTIAISPDQKEVLVGAVDKKIYVYSFDGTTLQQTSEINGSHRGKLTCIRYSHDGSLIAAGDSNREIVVYDSASKTPKYTGLVYHNSSITDLDFSADDKLLVSASVDNSIIVWDLENKKRIQQVAAHQQGVDAVKFIDQSTVVSAGGDFFLRTFNFGF